MELRQFGGLCPILEWTWDKCLFICCMYVCRSPFCDFVRGKRQHQLGQGERSFKEVPLSRPHEQTWLATHHWLSCSQLCSKTLMLVWETNPDPFAIGPSGNQTGDLQRHRYGGHEIPLEAVGLLLWLGVRRDWCRRSKYYISPVRKTSSSSQVFFQSSTIPTFVLQDMPRILNTICCSKEVFKSHLVLYFNKIL